MCSFGGFRKLEKVGLFGTLTSRLSSSSTQIVGKSGVEGNRVICLGLGDKALFNSLPDLSIERLID